MGNNDGALWLGGLLLLGGLLWALTSWQNHGVFMRSATLVQATVQEIEYLHVPQRGGRNRKEHWILFEFPVPDSAVNGEMSGGRLPDDRKRYSVGDTVAVYWQPAGGACRYASIRYFTLYGLASAAIGALLLLYYFAHLRHSPPDSEDYRV